MSLSLDFTRLEQAYAQQDWRPVTLVEEIYRRIAEYPDRHIWRHLVPREKALARAREVEELHAQGVSLPLYGLPYGVKDNIDVAGLPTTSGCVAFGYLAGQDAAVVERLNAAGAILIGKQNMDQFATGLVGVRNIDGHCLNAFDARYIPGGSSSGSAVAVAVGQVAFSIGSDTGGSGRIPAACNNVVGLKPTPGLVSTHGFVYCNRSFDVAPVFALTVDDAYRVLRVVEGFDPRDLFAQNRSAVVASEQQQPVRVAIPQAQQLEFFGDTQAQEKFRQTLAWLTAQGIAIEEVDFSPFIEAGRLLFDSPFLAERWLSYGGCVEAFPEAIHPAVQGALAKARTYDAAQVFASQYRLLELQRQVHGQLESMDALVVPTYGQLPTCQQVEADPLRVNSQMGYYTYFANPLRLCGMSVPVGFREDGLPFGISLLGLPLHDYRLQRLASSLQRQLSPQLGNTAFGCPD